MNEYECAPGFSGCVTFDNGTKVWYLNGEIHREDGPAMVHSDGTQEWWFEGKCHREDGPAIIPGQKFIGGLPVKEAWYLDGEWFSDEVDWKAALSGSFESVPLEDFDFLVFPKHEWLYQGSIP